jgi:hypothetical protein
MAELPQHILQGLQRCFDAHDIAALMHVTPFTQQLLENPELAIPAIRRTYDQALDEAYRDEKGDSQRDFVEAIAGGPYGHIPWMVYNAVGAVYPALPREQRDLALRQILDILDGRNYLEVNGATGAGHTTGIREPLLLGDITIARQRRYWPGLEEQMQLINAHPTFERFSEVMMDANGFIKSCVASDFLLAYALLRKPGWNEEYAAFAETFTPRFLERTMSGIAAINFGMGHPETEEGRAGRLHTLLPPRVHPLLEQAKERKDWVDYHLFR